MKSVKPDNFEYLPINLLSSFRITEYKRDLYAPYGFFWYVPPGTYTVQVELEGETSIVLSFKILEPVGSELDALTLLDKASKIVPVPENNQIYNSILKELLDNYPTSAYAGTCYEVLVLKDSSQAISEGSFDWDAYRIQLLRKYPNSGNCVGRLKYLKKYSKNINFTEFMATFNKEYPNSRSAKYGKFLLLNKKIE